MDFDDKLSFLRSLGTDRMEHSRGVLLDHLVGTYALLKNWDARPAVCDAGLFHSVYGTESYPSSAIPLELRPAVQEVIGVEAETLAHLFGVKRADPFYTQVRKSARLLSAASLKGGSDGLAQTEVELRHRLTGERIPCSPQQVFDLVNIAVANALEQAPRVAHQYQDNVREFFLDLRPLVLPAARAALDVSFGAGRAC